MVTKRKSSLTSAQVLTPQRAARLCKLLRLLRDGPQTCTMLIRRLPARCARLLSRSGMAAPFGIAVLMANSRYHLEEDAEKVIARLPFPDPQLTLGEAMLLAKGRTAAHRKLKEQISRIIP